MYPRSGGGGTGAARMSARKGRGVGLNIVFRGRKAHQVYFVEKYLSRVFLCKHNMLQPKKGPEEQKNQQE